MLTNLFRDKSKGQHFYE